MQTGDHPSPWGNQQDELVEATLGEPLRTHPLTVITGFLTSLPQTLYAIPALLFAGDSVMPFLIFIIPAILLLSTGFSWLAWSRFTYRIGKQDIRVDQGVLSRKSRAVPFERIQDVGLEQRPLARLLGLASVKIETGGGKGEDAELSYLKLPDAERLRDLIRDRRHGVTGELPIEETAADGDAPEGTDRLPLFAMDNRRLLLAGLFNFSLVLLGILAAFFQQFDNVLPFDIWDPRFWLGMVGDVDLETIRSLGLLAQIVGMVGILVMLIFIGLLSGVVRTILRDYGFRLDRVTAGFRRRRGLLTLTDVVLPEHRVQAGLILTGPIRRYFGWSELKFQSLAQDSKAGSDHSVAPLAQPHEIAAILTEANIENVARAEDYARTRRGPFLLPWAVLAAFLCISATLVLLLIHPLAGIAIYAFAALLPLLAWLRWKHHLYAVRGGQIYVRQGWWRQRLSLLAMVKAQSVDIARSPVDRLFGTASVVLGVAGGSSSFPLTVHALPESEAMRLRTRILDSAATVDFSQMIAAER